MSVALPSFHDPIATARQEAVPRLARGLPVHPTLIAFEGDEPTLYLRGRPPTRVDDDGVVAELLLLPDLLDLTRLLVVAEARLSPPDPTGADQGPAGSRAVRPEYDSPEAALTSRAITVDRVEREPDGAIRRDGLLLEFHLDDRGEPRFEPPEPMEHGGPWAAVLATRLESRPPVDPQDGFVPAGAAYALSRFGVVAAVAPGWQARYGLDRPVDPAMVRPEDRRRARRRLRRAPAATTSETGR